MTTTSSPFTVAVIGGGIAGLTLTLGLLNRGINVKLYEQAANLKEIGAGIAFSPNSVRCMDKLDSRISAAFRSVATHNLDPAKATSYFQWVDGYHHKSDPADHSSEWLFEIDEGDQNMEGCHRAHFLDALVKHVPAGIAEMHKHLDTISEPSPGSKFSLKFHDGTTAEADAVIGCDGIKSRVRQLLFGEDNPASYPHYSQKFAFRGLIPMEKATAALGTHKAGNRHMYMGPDAHILTFPVAKGTVMNVVAFVHDPTAWSDSKRLTLPATKEEAIERFKDWGADVRAITEMLEPQLDKWAIFDTWAYPLETFTKGRICVSGDAAHATTPHHGSGAGFCIEDSLVLSELLDKVQKDLSESASSEKATAAALTAAFAAFDASRRERSQWLVNSSRVVGDTYEWRNPHTCRDAKKCANEVTTRFRQIWNHDEQAMVADALEDYTRRLKV